MPANGSKPPLILIVVWALVLLMVAGYWLIDLDYQIAGLALFWIAGISLGIGSIVTVARTIVRRAGPYRST
jgi:hypothetical protein